MPYELTPEDIEFLKQRGIDPSTVVIPDDDSSALGAGGAGVRAFGAGVAPALGGLGGAAAGMAAAAPLGLATGPAAPFAVPALGLIGGVLGGLGVGAVQNAVLPEDIKQQLAQDQAEHPWATKAGSLATLPLGGFRPSADVLRGAGGLARKLVAPNLGKAVEGTIEQAERQALINTTVGAGMGAIQSAGTALATGQDVSAKDVLENAAIGAVFNRPWALGRAVGFHDPVQLRPDQFVAGQAPPQEPTAKQTRQPISRVVFDAQQQPFNELNAPGTWKVTGQKQTYVGKDPNTGKPIYSTEPTLLKEPRYIPSRTAADAEADFKAALEAEAQANKLEAEGKADEAAKLKQEQLRKFEEAVKAHNEEQRLKAEQEKAAQDELYKGMLLDESGKPIIQDKALQHILEANQIAGAELRERTPGKAPATRLQQKMTSTTPEELQAEQLEQRASKQGQVKLMSEAEDLATTSASKEQWRAWLKQNEKNPSLTPEFLHFVNENYLKPKGVTLNVHENLVDPVTGKLISGSHTIGAESVDVQDPTKRGASITAPLHEMFHWAWDKMPDQFKQMFQRVAAKEFKEQQARRMEHNKNNPDSPVYDFVDRDNKGNVIGDDYNEFFGTEGGWRVMHRIMAEQPGFRKWWNDIKASYKVKYGKDPTLDDFMRVYSQRLTSGTGRGEVKSQVKGTDLDREAAITKQMAESEGKSWSQMTPEEQRQWRREYNKRRREQGALGEPYFAQKSAEYQEMLAEQNARIQQAYETPAGIKTTEPVPEEQRRVLEGRKAGAHPEGRPFDPSADIERKAFRSDEQLIKLQKELDALQSRAIKTATVKRQIKDIESRITQRQEEVRKWQPVREMNEPVPQIIEGRPLIQTTNPKTGEVENLRNVVKTLEGKWVPDDLQTIRKAIRARYGRIMGGAMTYPTKTQSKGLLPAGFKIREITEAYKPSEEELVEAEAHVLQELQTKGVTPGTEPYQTRLFNKAATLAHEFFNARAAEKASGESKTQAIKTVSTETQIGGEGEHTLGETLAKEKAAEKSTSLAKGLMRDEAIQYIESNNALPEALKERMIGHLESLPETADVDMMDLAKKFGLVKKMEESEEVFTTKAQKLINNPPSGLLNISKDFNGTQLLGSLKNSLSPVEWDILQKAGIKEKFDGKIISQQDAIQWVRDNQPKVEVKSYGAEGKVSEYSKELGQLKHEWYDSLSKDKQLLVDGYMLGTRKESELAAAGIDLVKAKRYDELETLAYEDKHMIDNGTRMTGQQVSAYKNVSPKSTEEPMPEWTTSKSGKNVQRVDVVIPRQHAEYGIQTYRIRGTSRELYMPELTNEEYQAQKAKGMWKAYDVAEQKWTEIPTDADLVESSVGQTLSEKAGMKWQPDYLHEQHPNTLGWAAIQYETGKNGEKIAHIFEVQSRWGQEVRESARVAKEAGQQPGRFVREKDHPLLRDYNRLILKAAIEQARKEGATHIAISDAETAMMSEGHDLRVNPHDLVLRHPSGEENISQAQGMRLNYDKILPTIASELTGSKGEKVSLGEHKNALTPTTGVAGRPNHVGQWGLRDNSDGSIGWARDREHAERSMAAMHGGDWSLVQATESQVRGQEPRQNLIFRNADGTPKTDVTASMYPLEQTSKRLESGDKFTLFNKHMSESESDNEQLINKEPLKTEQEYWRVMREDAAKSRTVAIQQMFDDYWKSQGGRPGSKQMSESEQLGNKLREEIGDKRLHQKNVSASKEWMTTHGVQQGAEGVYDQATKKGYTKELNDNDTATHEALHSFFDHNRLQVDLQLKRANISIHDLKGLAATMDMTGYPHHANMMRKIIKSAKEVEFGDKEPINSILGDKSIHAIGKAIEEFMAQSTRPDRAHWSAAPLVDHLLGSHFVETFNEMYHGKGVGRSKSELGKSSYFMSEHEGENNRLDISRALLTEPALDKAARLGGATGKMVADAIRGFFPAKQEIFGRYASKPLELLSKMSLSDRKYVAQAMYREDLEGVSKRDTLLNNKQRAAYDAIRAALDAKQNDLIKSGRMIRVMLSNGKIVTRPPELNPHYMPSIPRADVVEALVEKTGDYKKYQKMLLDHWEKEGATPEAAQKKLANFSRIGDVKWNNRARFAAMRLAEGMGLPAELRMTDPAKVLQRYFNRVALDKAWTEQVESNKKVMEALDPRNPDGVSHAFEHIVEQVQGEPYDKEETTIKNLNRVFTSAFLGPLTNIHIVGSTLFNPFQYTKLTEAAGVYVKALSSLSGARQRAIENGYKTHDFNSVHDIVDSGNTFNQKLASLAAVVGKVNGREWSDTASKTMAQALAEQIIPLRLADARTGDKYSIDLIKQFDPKWTTDTKYTPKQLSQMASSMASLIHGAHDARTLPNWMLKESILKPFFSLMSWSVAQTNQWNKHVWQPAMRGNLQPLIMSSLGAAAGGYLIGELRKELNNKKGNIPLLDEIAKSDRGLSGNLPLIAYNFMQMASYTGFAGIGSQLTKDMFDLAYKNIPQGSAFPLDEAITGISKTVVQGIGAWMQNPTAENFFDIMPRMTLDLVKENYQTGRIALNWAADYGVSGETEAYKFKVNKEESGLRRYKMAQGLPYNEQVEMESNPYLNLQARQFKQTSDIGEAAQRVPGLVQLAMQRAQGNPDVLRQQMQSLKQNSYQTMPSPENMPLQFAKYYQYLAATRGQEAAQQVLQDYFRHNMINKMKSSMIPSL